MATLTKERDAVQLRSFLMARALQVYQAPRLHALDAAGRDELRKLRNGASWAVRFSSTNRQRYASP